MMHQFQITTATLAEAETIADFNIALALETEDKRLDLPTVLAGVRAVLSDPSKGRYFVARIREGGESGSFDAGSVVGQLMITVEWSDWRNGPLWWVQSVFVHKDHRRRGVFRAIFRHVLEAAHAESVPAVRLYVEEHNAAAQATYAALGMRPAGYFVYERSLTDPANRGG